MFKKYLILTSKFLRDLNSSRRAILFGEIIAPMVLYTCMHCTALKFFTSVNPNAKYLFFSGLLSYIVFSVSNVDGAFTLFLQRWTQSIKLLLSSPVNIPVIFVSMMTRTIIRVLIGVCPLFIHYAILNNIKLTFSMIFTLLIFVILYAIIGCLVGYIEAMLGKDFSTVNRFSSLGYLLLTLFSRGLLPTEGIKPNAFTKISAVSPISRLSDSLSKVLNGSITNMNLIFLYGILMSLIVVFALILVAVVKNHRDDLIQVIPDTSSDE